MHGASRKPRASVAAVALLIAAVSSAVSPSSASLYPPGGPVTNLDPSSFKQTLKGDGLWLVEFYAPWCGHCKALQPEWEKAAVALKGVVHVAAVDADEHSSLGAQYGVQGFPTIKLLIVEGGIIRTTDYNGGRTAKDIAKFAMDAASKLVNSRLGMGSGGSGGRRSSHSDSGFYGGTDVVALDSSNFDEMVIETDELWMVEFYAPWCGHCKALKPAWIAAASQLHGKVKLGAVNCEEENEVCERYMVRGFPTIKYFGVDKDRPQDYESGRDEDSIITYAISMWEKYAPPAEVQEIVDQEVFVNGCMGHDGDLSLELETVPSKTLCIIAFLPHILDSGAEGRNAYLQVLTASAEAFKGRPFSFLWSEGGKQPALEANLEVGGFGYPAVVAYSPKKNVFATMKTALEGSHMKEWISSLRQGGEKVVPIHGAIAEVESVEKWDGLDGQSFEEEEFDLSELDE